MAAPAVLDYDQPTWFELGLDLIETLAAKDEAFDAHALTVAGLDAPAHHSMWGQLFKQAAQQHLIRKVGYHESARPGRSRGVCAVWVGAA